MLICLLSGCSREPKNGDAQIAIKAEGTETETLEEYVYVPQIFEYSTEYQWINNIVALDEERLLVFGQWYYGRPYSQIMEVDMASGKTDEYNINIAQDRYIAGCAETDKGYVVFSESYKETEFEHELAEWEGAYLTYFDKDFKLISETDITDFCHIVNGASTFYFDFMSVDKEENVYFSRENDIYVVDKDGNQLAKLQANGSVESMIFVEEQVLVSYRDKGGKAVVVPIDVCGTGFSEPLKNIPDCGYSAKLFAGEEKTFYIAAQNSLFQYRMDTAEYKEAAKWTDCDLTGLGQLCIAKNERIISTYYGGNMSYELILLDKVKKSDVKEKTTLTVAMLQSNPYMAEQFMKFNRMNKDYRLEIKIYAADESPEALEAAIRQFHLDLISGNVGDIVCVTQNLDFTNLAYKGAFADLDELLELDSELNKSDFIENIADTLSVNGRLYGISPYFVLNTLVGKTSNVGNGNSWTADDVWNVMQRHEDSVLLYGMRNTDMLGMFLKYNMDSYYNSLTGECYFDEEAFKTILEIAATFPNELDLDEVNANWERISDYAEDIRLLTCFNSWYGVYALQYYRVIFGEEVNIIGYPVEQGIGTSASFGYIYAISAFSEKKEEAWQFIRQYLLKEYQERYIVYEKSGVVEGFPIRKDVFEQGIKEAMKKAPEFTYQQGDLKFGLEPLSEEDAEYFRRLVYGVDKDGFVDYQMYNIILEEAGAYFSGQKTVDEVASIIRNRVQLYVEEGR